MFCAQLLSHPPLQKNKVQFLLTRGFNIDDRQDGCSALLFAAQGGHIELFQWLLENGAPINDRSRDGCTALIKASLCGHFEFVRYLLHKGVDVNERDNFGFNAFLSATSRGHLGLLKCLVEHGADYRARTHQNKSALIIAASQGHLDVVRWLVDDLHVDTQERCRQGLTALLFASLEGHSAVVEWLLQAKHACVSERSTDGNTGLLLAAWSGHAEVIDILVARGADIFAKNEEGNTALQLAAWGRHPEIVEHLMRYGCSLEERNRDGFTAVLGLAQFGDVDMIRKLVVMGANLRVEMDEGRINAVTLASHLPEMQAWLRDVLHFSPLQMACEARMLKQIAMLLRMGADPFFRAECGRSVLDVAKTCAASVSSFAKPVDAECVELIRKARMPWSMGRHKLFGPEFRMAVSRIMSLSQTLATSTSSALPLLPPELWHEIASQLDRRDFDKQLVITGTLFKSSHMVERNSQQQLSINRRASGFAPQQPPDVLEAMDV